MRSLGIVRKMDQLGRFVIPKETRKVLNLNEGDPIEIFTDGDTIILKKYAQGCQCCGNTENIKELKYVRNVWMSWTINNLRE